jgi:small subunit ribosomal protein S16
VSVRVRLKRVGSKKNPIWRVVVTDQRSPRDGRFIESVGHYNPQTEPSTIVLDQPRLDHWLARGAVPTNTVKKLMRARPAEAEAEAPVAEAEPPAAVEEPAPAEAPAPAEEPAAEAAPPEESAG